MDEDGVVLPGVWVGLVQVEEQAKEEEEGRYWREVGGRERLSCLRIRIRLGTKKLIVRPG